MIGTALSNALIDKGHDVIILTRDAAGREGKPGVRYAAWDVEKQTIDTAAVQEADYIIHLAGANVAEKRWTEKRKQEIVDSRVQSGQLLAKTLQENENKVQAVISASAIGWYGVDLSVPNLRPFVEKDDSAPDFLGDTCVQWEQSLAPLIEMGKRVVWLRTGIVLSNEGGAYPAFKKPTKLGVAAILGDGKQIVSWIHINDLVQLYIAAMENESWRGAYNAVAPQPVSNQQLIEAIAKEKGTALKLHVPEILLKIALGEMSIEVLKSTTVSCAKAETEGYGFQFKNIEAAVHDLEQAHK